MKTFNYILINFAKMIVLIILVCIVTFTLAVNSPLDPIRQYVGDGVTVSVEQREAIAEYWGLNDTKVVRFQKWFVNILHGDFGKSTIFRREVLDVIKDRAMSSLYLMVNTFVLSGVLGYILGLIMGRYRDSILDKTIKTICITFTATPTFWVGILMLIIFSVKLNLFPVGFSVPIGIAYEDVSFYEKAYHAILPIITLTMVFIPNIALHTRSKTVEVIQSDYVLFAIARGESKKSILKNHVIKNTLIPAITILFGSFSEIFGGSVLAENVFSYPGLGSTIVQAGLGGDTPLLLGITIITAIFVFIGNFISDLISLLMNPMVREEI
jgi:peptide/nickel transport system permease protein